MKEEIKAIVVKHAREIGLLVLEAAGKALIGVAADIKHSPKPESINKDI